MALQTPYLIAPVAFDANNAQEIEFTVPAGGDQVQSNKLTILKQSDLSEVYAQKVTTQDYTHTIPAGTLTNGVVYVASVKTYNLAGEESAESNKVLLRCYSTPSFNLSVDSTISTSQVNIVVEYAQAQNEPLSTYLFNLYDSVGILIATSKTQYAVSDTSRITYQFNGLRSGQSYSVECLGVTKYGTQISTGSQTFFVQFIEPTAYKYFSLENVCKGGYIRIQSNLSSIPGETNKVPLEIGDGELTLYPNQWVKWNKGYVLPEDWTLQIWGHSFVSSDTTPIVTCANVSGDKVEVYWQEQVVKQPPLQWTWNATPTFPAQGSNLKWDIKFQANGTEYTKLNIQHDADGHKYIGYISSAGSTLAYDTGTWSVTSRDILFEENPSDDLLAILNTMATTTQSETETAYSCSVLKAWSAKAAYPYIIKSNTIESASVDTAHSIWVKKVGALYDIKIFNNQESDTIFTSTEINTLQIDGVVNGQTAQTENASVESALEIKTETMASTTQAIKSNTTSIINVDSEAKGKYALAKKTNADAGVNIDTNAHFISVKYSLPQMDLLLDVDAKQKAITAPNIHGAAAANIDVESEATAKQADVKKANAVGIVTIESGTTAKLTDYAHGTASALLDISSSCKAFASEPNKVSPVAVLDISAIANGEQQDPNPWYIQDGTDLRILRVWNAEKNGNNLIIRNIGV